MISPAAAQSHCIARFAIIVASPSFASEPAAASVFLAKIWSTISRLRTFPLAVRGISLTSMKYSGMSYFESPDASRWASRFLCGRRCSLAKLNSKTNLFPETFV